MVKFHILISTLFPLGLSYILCENKYYLIFFNENKAWCTVGHSNHLTSGVLSIFEMEGWGYEFSTILRTRYIAVNIISLLYHIFKYLIRLKYAKGWGDMTPSYLPWACPCTRVLILPRSPIREAARLGAFSPSTPSPEK